MPRPTPAVEPLGHFRLNIVNDKTPVKYCGPISVRLTERFVIVYSDLYGTKREGALPVNRLLKDYCVSLGSKLKDLRLRQSQSLQQVADAVKVSKTYVWQLERDEDTNPSVDVLKRIADHFKTTVAALVGESKVHESDEQLLRMFRNLEELQPKDREIIDDMIRSFKKRRAEGRRED